MVDFALYFKLHVYSYCKQSDGQNCVINQRQHPRWRIIHSFKYNTCENAFFVGRKVFFFIVSQKFIFIWREEYIEFSCSCLENMKSDVEELMPRLLPVDLGENTEELNLTGPPRNPQEYLRQVQ